SSKGRPPAVTPCSSAFGGRLRTIINLRLSLPCRRRFCHEFSLFVHRGVKEGAEFAAARRMAELAQRFGLDLANALARHGKALAHLFERMLAAVVQTKAHLDNFFLARRQG